MTTLNDFVPLEIRKVVVASGAFLALFVAGSHLHSTLKTGVAQRLPNTCRYSRSERPVMFWLLVIFFGASAIIFAAMVLGVFFHWNDDKVF
jgi:hypothetical protein